MIHFAFDAIGEHSPEACGARWRTPERPARNGADAPFDGVSGRQHPQDQDAWSFITERLQAKAVWGPKVH